MLNLIALSRSALALRQRLFTSVLCLLSAPALADTAWLNASQLAGNLAQARLTSWQQLISNSTSLDTTGKLRAANQLINNSIRYASDQQTWNQKDYWAAPAETLKRGQGDCEDFAIAKYFSLIKMGIASSQLRLMHVKDLSSNSAHMILAYYPSPQAQPLILDNLNGRIVPIGQRQDLLAIYSFNAEGVYLPSAPEKIAQPASLLSHWVALNNRIQRGHSQL